jgi:hypothetical protein
MQPVSYRIRPASRRRRRKRNPVPGCITGPPCSCGIWIRRPGRPGWRSVESETVKFGHVSHGTRTREWLRWRGPAAVVKERPVLSRQRGRPTSTNPKLINKIWPWAPVGRLTPRYTGRLTVSRNITFCLWGIGDWLFTRTSLHNFRCIFHVFCSESNYWAQHTS